MRSVSKFLGVALLGLLSGYAPSPVHAADTASTFTKAQKAEIENIVRDLLTKQDPEIVIKAAQAAQQKYATESAEKATEALSQNSDQVFKDASDPVGGNPKGDVTLVEFFDYQCGYCKSVAPSIQNLLKEDKNIRFVYKEYPILGPGSEIAAKAALASIKQGKYFAFHDKLMAAHDHFTEESVMKLAKEVGLDVKKLKKDMDDEAIEKKIQKDRILGTKIGANGTPTFVLGNKLYPGAVPLPQMKKLIEEERKKEGK